MLLCDGNVLLYAMRADSPHHTAYGPWLESVLEGIEPVGIGELVLSGVVRIATNHRIFEIPSSPAECLAFCEAVLTAPAAVRVRPGERHWSIFADLVRAGGIRANSVPDAYLAALALENDATWVTRDRGFARFPGLRILDPATN